MLRATGHARMVMSDVVRPSFEANDLKSWEGARGVQVPRSIFDAPLGERSEQADNKFVKPA